ncbi:MAG TPA: DUF5063 domain-containing protein [Acidobacteriaceae bacterium]|nr:DUF5063 domain-containing protein [Acidobacteriaceae bacterium]
MNCENQSYRHFQTLAQVYCECVENSPDTGLTFLRNIRDRLLPLYAAALHFPEVKNVQFRDDFPDKDDMTTEQRFSLSRRLRGLGFTDTYRLIYHPLENDPDDPMHGSLVDDLSDIWWDIKPGLNLLERKSDDWAPEVFWDWKESFQTHWGRHAIEALRALHEHLQDT